MSTERRNDDPTEDTFEDDEALAADNPRAAYQTVPGTERLPAAVVLEEGDGIYPQEDDNTTERFRKDSVTVIALGQVKA